MTKRRALSRGYTEYRKGINKKIKKRPKWQKQSWKSKHGPVIIRKAAK